MGLFSKKKKKVVVIGIDGVPFTFIRRHIEAGDLPNFKALLEKGDFRQMNSVMPCISSVAWSSYMTGCNPAKHNIFGFIDRKPNPFEMYIPTSVNMKAPTLWQILSENKLRVVVINVPVTYPPKEVNGVLIGDFLATDLRKAVYPSSVFEKLDSIGYRIDVDAWAGREDKDKFLEDINYTIDKRIVAANWLFESQKWDFFQLHIMSTDRINHFLWDEYEGEDPKYAPQFLAFYRKIDHFLGEVEKRVDQESEFIVLSDHGFCSIKKEVFTNYWLEKEGYLKFNKEKPSNLKDMSPETRVYSLIPGRFFVNLKGREQFGVVEPGVEYEKLRDELVEKLPTMTDPETGEKIIRNVYKREEIYSGPCFEQAADVIADPHDGYDLKANLNQGQLALKGSLEGMHTYDDASLYIRSREIKGDSLWVADLMPTILSLLDVRIPEHVDGKVVV
jgi:predicted AlkP superfamily phosphohydrolase/phosphomutase